MNKHEVCTCADAFQNDKFIWIKPLSGHGCFFIYDPQGEEALLKPDVDNVTLGAAVRQVLATCRVLPAPIVRKLIKDPKTLDPYNERVKTVMSLYKYKTKSAMFACMKNCGITLFETKIKLAPMIHKRLDSWERSKNHGIEDVIIPVTSREEELGAALRLAFSRCRERV